MNRQMGLQTDKWIDEQTDGFTDRQMDKQTDRWIYREMPDAYPSEAPFKCSTLV
jgi:hypothetical protein